MDDKALPLDDMTTNAAAHLQEYAPYVVTAATQCCARERPPASRYLPSSASLPGLNTTMHTTKLRAGD